ncbi:MAG: phasin family protein [Candidatus Contendobacter sp.]|jgi:phasin family protein|nr:phasin family protein [Candidatus Contendobacter sp.]
MSNNVLAKLVEQYQNFLESAIKANQLSVANMEALIKFQMNASVSRLQSYMTLAKAAADINDMASYQTFLASQAETASSLQHKFSDDAKTLADLMGEFKAEYEQLMRDRSPATDEKQRS